MDDQEADYLEWWEVGTRPHECGLSQSYLQEKKKKSRATLFAFVSKRSLSYVILHVELGTNAISQ